MEANLSGPVFDRLEEQKILILTNKTKKNYRLDRTRLIEIIDLHFTTSYLPENYDHLPETAESLPETAKTTVQNQMNKSVCFDLPDIDDSSEISTRLSSSSVNKRTAIATDEPEYNETSQVHSTDSPPDKLKSQQSKRRRKSSLTEEEIDA